MFVALFALGIDLPGLPDWLYLIAAAVLNLWVVPLPGLHSRAAIEAESRPALQAPAAKPEAAAKPEPKAGPSDKERLQQGLSKSSKGFAGKLAGVFRRSSAVDDETLNMLEETLVGSDVGIKTAYLLLETIKQGKEKITSPEQALSLLQDQVAELLSRREQPLTIPEGSKPYVIMVSGVNGAGKTTTIAKLARRFIGEGRSVIVAAGDTYRAAAIDQLRHWAERVGADFINSQEGADPSAVAYDGLQAAIARGHDVLIIDTAGRLHTKENLMEELKKTRRVLEKLLPGTPHETLLVLDATQGQNAIEQTRQFGGALDISGLVLTKLDGSARGGVIVGIANEFEIPIRFIGVGEGMDDLQVFEAASFTEALFKENQDAA
ncbi:MAG: Signal recognition particle receptor FtsY [Deltaproteobacteria bacterium ADurb.Bin510]|nr:MAG: Signal recognition particle receptor FtsY [Deltaproteobacteria bacterium ADurb.Bin510]